MVDLNSFCLYLAEGMLSAVLGSGVNLAEHAVCSHQSFTPVTCTWEVNTIHSSLHTDLSIDLYYTMLILWWYKAEYATCNFQSSHPAVCRLQYELRFSELEKRCSYRSSKKQSSYRKRRKLDESLGPRLLATGNLLLFLKNTLSAKLENTSFCHYRNLDESLGPRLLNTGNLLPFLRSTLSINLETLPSVVIVKSQNSYSLQFRNWQMNVIVSTNNSKWALIVEP